MYINYGDVNFYENGLLVDTEHSDTVFDMLVCRPYSDEEDLFQFAHITVDVEDNWIEWNKIREVIGDIPDDNVSKAIMAYEYYGPSEFGAYSNVTYDWMHMTRDSIKKELKGYLIAWDNLVLE